MILELDPNIFSVEMLHYVLFSSKNVIINSFIKDGYLQPLMKMVNSLYNYTELNGIGMNTSEYLSTMFENHDYSLGKPFYYLKNLDYDSYEILLNEMPKALIIIASEQIGDNINKLMNHDSVIVYSPKSNSFSEDPELNKCDFFMENSIIAIMSRDFPFEENLNFCCEILDQIRIQSSKIYEFYTIDQRDKAKEINDKLVRRLTNGSKSKKIIISANNFIEHHLKLHFDLSINFRTKLLELNPPPTESVNIPISPFNNHIETSIKNINKKKINDGIHSEEFNLKLKKFSKELKNIKETSKNSFNSFKNLLNKQKEIIKPKYCDILVQPHQIYNELRLDNWKDGIPIDFSNNWLRLHIFNTRKLQKNDSIDDIYLECKDQISDILRSIGMKVPTIELKEIKDIEVKLDPRISSNNNNNIKNNFEKPEDFYRENKNLENKKCTNNSNNELKESFYEIDLIKSDIEYIKESIKNSTIIDLSKFKESLNRLQGFIK